MPHDIYKKRIKKDIQSLINSSDEIELIKHKGLRGSFRESEIGKILNNYLPFGFEIGSGEIIDSYRNTSNEVDLLIYNRSMIPPILFQNREGCYPVESCYYAFEIKTTSNSTEIRSTIEKFKNLNTLNSLELKRSVIKVYFAFKSDITGSKSELERFSELDENFYIDPILDVICIIGKGYWYCHKNYINGKIAHLTWHYFDSMADNYEIGVFLSGIINTLSVHNQFGYYVIDSKMKKNIQIYLDNLIGIKISFENSKEFNEAIELARNKQYEEAFTIFGKILPITKQLASFLLGEAFSLFEKTNYEESIIWFKKSLELDNSLEFHFPLFHKLGIAYYNTGKIEESIIEYEKAIKINPGIADLHFCLGQSKFHIAGLNPLILQEAFQSMTKVIELKVLDEQAFMIRSMIRNCLGDMEGAKKDIIQAIGINPNNHETLKQLKVIEYNISLRNNNIGDSLNNLNNWLYGIYK